MSHSGPFKSYQYNTQILHENVANDLTEALHFNDRKHNEDSDNVLQDEHGGDNANNYPNKWPISELYSINRTSFLFVGQQMLWRTWRVSVHT